MKDSKLRKFVLVLWSVILAGAVTLLFLMPEAEVNTKIPALTTLTALVTSSIVTVAFTKQGEKEDEKEKP